MLLATLRRCQLPTEPTNAAQSLEFQPLRKPGWYVYDYEANVVLRGVYETAEMAAAVRTEMEVHGKYGERNLWIVNNETLDKWEGNRA